jgi:cell division protein FtsA
MIGKKNEYGKLEILGVGKSKSLGVAREVKHYANHTIDSTSNSRSRK